MTHDDANWTFAGFQSPNFTSVPDEFFDALVPRLGNAELRVLLYIIRRTFGFKKQCDSISLSQMVDGIVRKDGTRLDAGTGLKKAAVCRALASLQRRRIIIRTKQFAYSGGAIATSYRLHMRDARPEEGRSDETPVYGARQGTDTPCLRRETGPVSPRQQGVSTGGDTQDTVNKKQFDKNVNASKKKNKRNPVHDLHDIEQHPDLTALIAADILAVLGDPHSTAFYRLVARKVPESVIRRTLSEIKQGGVESPAKVFTSSIMAYARAARASGLTAALGRERNALAETLSAPRDVVLSHEA